MTRQELIDFIVENSKKTFAARGVTDSQIRTGLDRNTTSELQKMYDRILGSRQVPEDIAARAVKAVQASPEYAENQRLRNQIVQNQGFAIIFGTPIPQANGRTAKDCEANRIAIREWAEAETNPILDVRKWWLGIFDPEKGGSLGLAAWDGYGPIVWDDLPLTKEQQQAQQAQKDAQFRQDAETFYEFARKDKRISASHANFLLVYRTLGPGLPNLFREIVSLPNGPAILKEDGSEINLDPPNRAELAKWQNELFEEDQDRLKEMANTNDIASLRARAKRDHERNSSGLDQARIQFEYSLLQSYSQRAEYNLPPLPEKWNGIPLDPSFLRKASPDTLRAIMSKHGSAQMNARLHQLPQDFFNHWQIKLRQLEEQLGMRRADFTRPSELAQALNQNRN
jgi:hypothetical protein